MGSGRGRAILVALWLVLVAAAAERDVHVYIGQIEAERVLIAWGRTNGRGNTIGRESASMGMTQVLMAGRSVRAERNWVWIDGLKPDTEYPYEVMVDGQRIGEGSVRTWPRTANRLAFFVIGDWGSGRAVERRVAQAMIQTFNAHREPVRFVLTTGDNIYADKVMGVPMGKSGDADAHWQTKFFLPHRALMRRIPFYPSLGNHDGNESENQGDLPVYLDNFFFPGNRPARFYRFNFAGLADFFSLDSTTNSLNGPPGPFYREDGEQSQWLKKELAGSRARWKIPYFHHPPYSAGPLHAPYRQELSHWLKWFEEAGVKVAFSGHEHNFQFSDRSKTGGVCYVVSGAGGELREKSVKQKLEAAGIAGWSAENHFLLVEIEGVTMRITPIGVDGRPLQGMSVPSIEAR